MSWTFIRSCRIQKRESRINCRAMHCFLWEWGKKSNKRREHLLSKFTKTITEHQQHSGYPTLDMGRFCDSTGTTNWARNGLKSSDWSYNCQNVTNRSTLKMVSILALLQLPSCEALSLTQATRHSSPLERDPPIPCLPKAISYVHSYGFIMKYKEGERQQ